MNSGPEPVPPRDRRHYLDVTFPDHFVVESADAGAWVDYNGYLGEDCQQLEDGSYACGHRGGGSPLQIRCVVHLADGSFIHLDGTGQAFRYRLVELPMPHLD